MPKNQIDTGRDRSELPTTQIKKNALISPSRNEQEAVRMIQCAFEHDRGELLFPEMGQNSGFDR